jgi:hypothetical protein
MITPIQMPDAALRVSLRYSGPEVEDGTMPIGDAVHALQGFAGAYSKIAALYDPTVQHQLRISTIREGSWDAIIVVWAVLAQNSAQLQALGVVTIGARWIANTLFSAIKAKLHTAGQPYSVTINGDNNNVNVTNHIGTVLVVDRPTYDLFITEEIDSDLSKIAAPLEAGRIDSVEMTASDERIDNAATATINSHDKPIFSSLKEQTTTSKETDVEGRFISLNKDSNRGTFELAGGKHVRYRYKGEDAFTMHADFAYRGMVRVRCVASFDDNLEVIALEIKAVQRLQRSLF